MHTGTFNKHRLHACWQFTLGRPFASFLSLRLAFDAEGTQGRNVQNSYSIPLEDYACLKDNKNLHPHLHPHPHPHLYTHTHTHTYTPTDSLGSRCVILGEVSVPQRLLRAHAALGVQPQELLNLPQHAHIRTGMCVCVRC
jgi:hypothetical protein